MPEDKKQEFPVSDIEIMKLSEVTLDFAKDFDCGTKDLNNFLRDDALRQQKESVNLTYLWVSKSARELLGFISLCNDSIHLSGRKKEEMKTIGLDYKALPALKICRMGVSSKYAGRKIGTRMVAFAISTVLELNKYAGCRFLTLEAKNDRNLPEPKRPIHFYNKNGFLTIKERGKPDAAYIPMYKDLKPILNESIESERKRTFGAP
ncbi:MAG: GNAT family N-acetyltransferase [Candidatus Diapherotrites archaeon]